MSADAMQMRLNSAVWHIAAGTVELSFESLEPPAPPEWVPGDQWYGGSGDRLTVSIPAKKATALAPTGWARTGTDPVSGQGRYTLYTYNGTTWANPKPCDANGTPL
jgi:hypothetical protein